jgi:hypothetical protein
MSWLSGRGCKPDLKVAVGCLAQRKPVQQQRDTAGRQALRGAGDLADEASQQGPVFGETVEQ